MKPITTLYLIGIIICGVILIFQHKTYLFKQKGMPIEYEVKLSPSLQAYEDTLIKYRRLGAADPSRRNILIGKDALRKPVKK
jgi:hypothetical protein